MCLPEKVTIAIFGGSCTGKSTFVKYIAKKYSYQSRHCGDIIREKAHAIGSDISKLEPEFHSRMDKETIKWAKDVEGPKLVEGRFLNYVLSDDISGLILIRFSTSADIRARRHNVNISIEEALRKIRDLDSNDRDFCDRSYHGISPLTPHYTIDTSQLSCIEIERKLLEVLK